MVPTWAGTTPEQAPFPPPTGCEANVLFYRALLREHGFTLPSAAGASAGASKEEAATDWKDEL